jgi:hypothetical protein
VIRWFHLHNHAFKKDTQTSNSCTLQHKVTRKHVYAAAYSCVSRCRSAIASLARFMSPVRCSRDEGPSDRSATPCDVMEGRRRENNDRQTPCRTRQTSSRRNVEGKRRPSDAMVIEFKYNRHHAPIDLYST